MAAVLDPVKEIRRAVDTGKAVFGKRQVEKSILNAKAQLIIISKNTPALLKEKIVHQAAVAEIPSYAFEGTALELGKVCGKPFVVSLMAVEDPGKSNVPGLAKGK